MIPLTKIRPNPQQPRRGIDPDNLEELAQSIREIGLLCPILLRPSGDAFEIVHGERRYRACQLAGLTEIPAEVRQLSDEQAFLISLTENLQREQLNPIDEAMAYDRLRTDFSMTEGVIAKKIGRSQAYVAERLSLLRLSEPTQDMIIARAISPSVGRMLARLDDSERAEELALEVAQGALTVRGLRDRMEARVPEDGCAPLPPELAMEEELNRREETALAESNAAAVLVEAQEAIARPITPEMDHVEAVRFMNLIRWKLYPYVNARRRVYIRSTYICAALAYGYGWLPVYEAVAADERERRWLHDWKTKTLGTLSADAVEEYFEWCEAHEHEITTEGLLRWAKRWPKKHDLGRVQGPTTAELEEMDEDLAMDAVEVEG